MRPAQRGGERFQRNRALLLPDVHVVARVGGRERAFGGRASVRPSNSARNAPASGSARRGLARPRRPPPRHRRSSCGTRTLGPSRRARIRRVVGAPARAHEPPIVASSRWSVLDASAACAPPAAALISARAISHSSRSFFAPSSAPAENSPGSLSGNAIRPSSSAPARRAARGRVREQPHAEPQLCGRRADRLDHVKVRAAEVARQRAFPRARLALPRALRVERGAVRGRVAAQAGRRCRARRARARAGRGRARAPARGSRPRRRTSRSSRAGTRTAARRRGAPPRAAPAPRRAASTRRRASLNVLYARGFETSLQIHESRSTPLVARSVRVSSPFWRWGRGI